MTSALLIGRWLVLIGLVLAVTSVVIAAAGGDPGQVGMALVRGSLGSQLGRVLATVAPLLLTSSGLLLTFATRLYNLGVEGQMMIGAIATTGLMRWAEGQIPPAVGIPLGLVAGALGGLGWGLLTGCLYWFAGISEIFAGLGGNFVATGAGIWLIFGPWQRQGIASMSGTAPLDPAYRLPAWGDASPVALGLGVLALVGVMAVMQTTLVGLRLRAVGHNPQAAFVLGIPTRGYVLGAFAGCGLLAGLAGAVQVLGVFHRLIPNISSGLGFLGLLVVLLVRANPWGVLPVVVFFAALNVGSLQLPLSLNLESSLAGVIQGVLVLVALLGQAHPKPKLPLADRNNLSS
ncbi:MAG: hypothetical protein Q6J78_03760 [Thermostichales cyanobacterium SRBZ-1_bins_19]